MLTIKNNEILIVKTKSETFTFINSKSGICGIDIERYNVPFADISKEEKAYLTYKINNFALTPILKEFSNDAFSIEIKSENNSRSLCIKLQDKELLVMPKQADSSSEK